MAVSLLGIHEDGGEDILRLPKNGGVIVFTERIGFSDDTHGRDYRRWSDQGWRVVVRLNNDYFPGGTIPARSNYPAFARRVASFINNSRGCTWWTIGNEMNHMQEWPYGTPITAANYVECWAHIIGQEIGKEHLLSPGAVGPWNAQSTPKDYILYFAFLMEHCPEIGWINLHAYTHGPDPALITSEARMGPPFEDYYYNFRTYRDFLGVVPAALRSLPVIITEANQNQPWVNIVGSRWVQEMYREVDEWNHGDHHQIIRAACLYRWPKLDDKFIIGKQNIIYDFQAAVGLDYTVPEEGEPEVPEWKELFFIDCEGKNDSAFYDQGGISELTLPIGLKCHYIHGGTGHFPRPELDMKKLPQTEVYEGEYSTGGFYLSADGRFGYVSDRIYLNPGDLARGEVMYMQEFNGVAAGGSRIGICQGDGPFTGDTYVWPLGGPDPFEHSAITWGSWRGTYVGVGFLPDREWAKLATPEVTVGTDFVRLVVQFNADTRGEGSHGHWDNFLLEAVTEKDPQPPAGECNAEAVMKSYRVAQAEMMRAVGAKIRELGQLFINYADVIEGE